MAMDESIETAGAVTSAGAQGQGAAESAESAGVADGAAMVETVTYPVAPGCRLNVRRGPSTTSPLVRTLAYDVRVQIRCQTRGEKVTGPYGTSDIWDNIATGEYVADAYVKTGSDGFVAVRCA